MPRPGTIRPRRGFRRVSQSNPVAVTEPAAGRTAQVARAGTIMFFSILLSRILGMARDSVMLAQFSGLETDAYKIAVRIPDTIFMLIAGGGLSSAFIPVFSDLLHKNKEKEAWKTFSVVTTLCAIIATVLIAVAWGLAPWIVRFFQEKNPDSVIPLATETSRIMLPAQFAFLVGSVLLATLYARKQFIAPGLAPNVYNFGMIVGAALLPRLFGMGIESMAWGALVGAFIGNILLPILSMAKVGSHFKPSLDVKDEGTKRFFILLLPVILGFSLPSMVNLITQKFAGFYNGIGGAVNPNTVLDTANNLMQAPLGFFGQALALAVFPVLSEYVAKDRMDLYREQVSKTLRTVIYLGTMSGALMLALAPLIVHVLYGWGKAAGSPEKLDQISQCLQIYAFAIFAWCMQPVLMRGFFSLHKTLKPVVIGTAMTGVFILLCIVATHTTTNFRVLPWATNVAALLLAVILFFALESDVGRLDRKGVLETWLKATVAGAVGGLVAYAGSLLAPHHAGKLLDLGLLFLFGLLGFWAFFFTGRLLKMPESEYLDRALEKFRRRTGRA